MEKVFRYILNHKKRMLKITIAITCIIVIIIVSASHYHITIDDGVYDDDKVANVPANVRSHIDESALDGYTDDSVDLKTKKSKSGGYALDVDLDELVDNIIKDLDKYEGRLNVYLSKGKRHEYLKKMIKAEYITQYPDLRKKDKIGTKVSGDEFQGVIQFNRHKSDGTEQILEYMPLGQEDAVNGDTLYGLINQANGKGGVSDDVIQSARDKILNYFSVDVHGNLIVANWSETITKKISGEYDTEFPGKDAQVDYSEDDRQYLGNATEDVNYEYFTHIINYKSSISKYTMPFNYLWAFLVCGRDEEFISEFADLVLDSKIVISVYDNLTEIEETTIDAYNDSLWQQTKTSARILVDGHEISSTEGAWSTPERVSTIHKYDINYIKTYSNEIVVAVTDLNIWFMNYSATYTYEVVDKGEEKKIDYLEPIEEEKVFTEGEWQTVSRTEKPVTNATGQVIGNKVTEKQEKTDIMTWHTYTQRTFTNIYHEIKYKYTLNGDPVVKEKTDPKLKEGEEGYPNFCTLYLKSQCAMANINGIETWLFAIIERNSDTVNMLELTKYMLYCATGMNFGVTEFDFSVYPGDGLLDSTEGFGIIVHTGKSDPKMVLNKEQIEKIIKINYSGQAQANLLSSLDAFMNIQNDYYVNAVFAIAVVQNESSAGTNWALIDKSTYNWASVTGKKGGGYVDKNGTSWNRYNSFSEATRDFGNLIANGSYYFMAGNYTVGAIGQKYCLPPDGWIRKVSSTMMSLYNSINVQIGGEIIPNPDAGQDGYTGKYTNSFGRTFYEYKQYMGSWKNKPYARGTMKSYGCYPTSVAIIASGYNSSITPETVRATKNSSGLASATGFFNSHGISSIDTRSSGRNISQTDIANALSQGKAVMIHVERSKGSTLTRTEHWIALIDIKGNQVYASNPGNTRNTGWLDFSIIMQGLDRVIYVG